MDVGTWPGFVRISSKTSCAYNTPGKERRPHVWIYSEFTVNLQPVAVRQMFELVGNQERFGFLECFLGPATLLAAGVWQPGGLGLPRPAGKPEGADPLLQTASWESGGCPDPPRAPGLVRVFSVAILT